MGFGFWGDKVKQLLIASGGNFSQFEIKVKKTYTHLQDREVAGQYVTQAFLEKEGWDSDMIQHSKEWATERNLIRTSAIHGKEEWKIPLKESFAFKDTSREEVSAEASAEGEDWGVFVMRTFIFLIFRFNNHTYIGSTTIPISTKIRTVFLNSPLGGSREPPFGFQSLVRQPVWESWCQYMKTNLKSFGT